MSYEPLLQRVPDARRAPFPLLPPLAYPYLGVLFGPWLPSLLAIVSAFTLRRWRTSALGAGLATVGVLSFVPIALLFRGEFGPEQAAVLWFATRIVSAGLGVVLYRVMGPHSRGHRFLGGRELPLNQVVLGGFAISFLLPGPVRAALLVPLAMVGSYVLGGP